MDFLDNFFEDNNAAVTDAKTVAQPDPPYEHILTELTELRVEYNRVVSELSRTKSTLERAQKLITTKALPDEVNRHEKKLKAEHDRVVCQLMGEYEEKFAKSLKQIRDLSATNARLAKKATEKNETVEDEGGTMKRLKTEIADIKVEKQELENRVVRLDADLDKTKARAETLENELNKLKRNLSASQQENGRLRDTVTSLRQENQRLQDSVNASNILVEENKRLTSHAAGLEVEIYLLRDLMTEEEPTEPHVQESDEEDCDMEEIRRYFEIPPALSPMSECSENDPVERVDKAVQTSVEVVTCREVQTEAGWYGDPNIQQYMNQIRKELAVEMASQLSGLKDWMSGFHSGFATGSDMGRNRRHRSANHDFRRFPGNLQFHHLDNDNESVSFASVTDSGYFRSDSEFDSVSERHSERDTASPVHARQIPTISVALDSAQSTRNMTSMPFEDPTTNQSHRQNDQHHPDNASIFHAVIASTPQQTPSLEQEKAISSTQEVESSNFHEIQQTPEVTNDTVRPKLRISSTKKSKTTNFKRPVCRKKKLLSEVPRTLNENDVSDVAMPPQKRPRVAHVPKETKTFITSPCNSVIIPQLHPTLESSSVKQSELASIPKPFESIPIKPYETFTSQLDPTPGSSSVTQPESVSIVKPVPTFESVPTKPYQIVTSQLYPTPGSSSVAQPELVSIVKPVPTFESVLTKPYPIVTSQLHPTPGSSLIIQPELVSIPKPVPTTHESVLSEPIIMESAPASPSNNDVIPAELLLEPATIPNTTVCMDTSEVISQHNQLQESSTVEKEIKINSADTVDVVKQKPPRPLSKSKKAALKRLTTNLVLSIFDYPSNWKVEETVKVLAEDRFRQFPKMIATVIVEVCAMDIEGTFVRFSDPTAPTELTQVQYILLKLLVKLRQTEGCASVVTRFIDHIEEVLLKVTLPCHIQSLGGLHLAMLRIDLDFPRMRAFMTIALAAMGVKQLVKYLRLVVVSWPDAFPKYASGQTMSALVARSYSQVINVLTTSKELVKPLLDVKQMLRVRRQYPIERESTEELIDALFLALLNVPCLELKSVFLMLSKRIDPKIVLKQLDLKVKPLINDPSVNETVICAVLQLIGFVVVRLCETSESPYATETVHWLTKYGLEPHSSKVRDLASSVIVDIANL